MNPFTKTRTLVSWLTKRDYFCNDLEGTIASYENDLKQLQRKTANKLQLQLGRYLEQANFNSNNSQWTLREKQQAATEAKRIKQEIARLNS